MNILEIIDKIRGKNELTEQEIKFIFDGYLKTKIIQDYQMSALCMAIVINGLNLNNTFLFTREMLNSGISLDFKNIKGIIIDKHSTGGVGDRVSLALMPICAALGIKVAKLSGRGLGHTGGTIDKMESINMKTILTPKQYLNQLKTIGFFDMAQSEEIVPADKKIYELRNLSGTVESLELIASSVVSKKIALKTDYVFIDIKVGTGALVKTISEAKKLANIMLYIFNRFKRKAMIHITNMSQPLGRSVGNAIEIKATIDTLNGNFETEEFKELVYTFIGDILISLKKAKNKTEATEKINYVIQSKSALNLFYEWVSAQKGNIEAVKNNSFFNPKYAKEVKSNKDGYIKYVSTKEIGMISFNLGAGKLSKSEAIDMQAGIYLNKTINEYVKKGETIATLYSSKLINDEYCKRFLNNIIFNKSKHKQEKMILFTLSNI